MKKNLDEGSSSKGKRLAMHGGDFEFFPVHLSKFYGEEHLALFRGTLIKIFQKFFFQIFFWGQRSNLVKYRKFCNLLEMVPNVLFWHETSFKVEKN